MHQNINNATPLKSSFLADKEKDASCDNLDYSLPFSKFVDSVKSTHNRKLAKFKHNYWVLYSLYHGDVVDDYNQKPKNLHTGKDIYNASKRVHELINKYGVKISRRTVEGSRNVEFYLKR